jgi:hypothetical protein
VEGARPYKKPLDTVGPSWQNTNPKLAVATGGEAFDLQMNCTSDYGLAGLSLWPTGLTMKSGHLILTGGNGCPLKPLLRRGLNVV